MKILTEDGVEVGEGDRAYDYYTMKPGVVGKLEGERVDEYINRLQQGSKQPWFTFHHDGGTTALLNGQRICSEAMARTKGWLPEPIDLEEEQDYANLADEMNDPDVGPWVESDWDVRAVANAKRHAEKNKLPWPPQTGDFDRWYDARHN
jgi:hypothetical protein